MSSTASTMAFRDALRARNRSEINRIAADLIEQCVPLGNQWFNIAQVLLRNGEVRLSISAAAREMDDSPGSIKARFHYAQILAMAGRQEEAITLIPAISSAELDPVERNHFLGTCALEVGDFELAKSAFNRVVASRPDVGSAWLSLASLPPDDDEALLEIGRASGRERV